MGATAWSFTKIVVGNLEAEVAFYREVFGLEEGHRMKGGLDGAHFQEVFFISGARTPVLGLLMYLDRQPPQVGETVTGFSTTDIAGLFERAKRHGAIVRLEPMNSKESFGFTVGLLEDPEGHLVEVLEVAT